MKKQLLLLLFLMTFPVLGQNIELDNVKLKNAFIKIQNWDYEKYGKSSFDSLQKFNDNFEKIVLKVTSSNPKSLNYNFKDLTKLGLNITTSKDGLFRIYSWDDQTGGSMRYFRNVFQYKGDNKTIHSKILPENENSNDYQPNDFTYNTINDIVSEGKTYYIVYRIFIGSSAAYFHQIKMFSIDENQLNDKAKLIKTQTGIKNTIGYEIDFSASVNKSSMNFEKAYITYDEATKTILIPLVAANGKLTDKKIKYQFKEKYFEKI